MGSSKTLYVMISKTDTGIGKLIREISGYPYNHVSLTLDPTFRSFVSFARIYAGIPLHGSFIRESAERFLAKGERIDVKIFAIPLQGKRARALEKLFSLAGTMSDRLTYNHLDLLTSALGLRVHLSGAYTCLGFAQTVLEKKYNSIRELDEDLSSMLYYDGPLNELAPDNGSREDIYFTQTNLFQYITLSVQSMIMLLGCLLPTTSGDAVSAQLNEISTADLTENL